MHRPTTLLLLAVIGCGGDDVPNIEGEQTISQGIYGQLVNGCDTSDCHVTPADGIPVFLFSSMAGLPSTGNNADTQAFDATASSNADGLYELEVPPGSRVLCRGYFNDQPTIQRYFFGPCIEVQVPTGTIRRNWASGPAGGGWSGR